MYHDTYVWMGTINPLLLLLVGLVMLLVDFVPTFIAVVRNHPNRLAILLMNIIFGWTGLGWLVLMIWSLTSRRASANLT